MKTLSYLVILMALTACSATDSKPQLPKDWVSKFGFFNRMDNEAPEKICVGNQYFRPCLGIDASTCLNLVSKAMPSCKSRLEPIVPNFMDKNAAANFAKEYAVCMQFGVMKALNVSPETVKQCIESKKR